MAVSGDAGADVFSGKFEKLGVRTGAEDGVDLAGDSDDGAARFDLRRLIR